MPNVSISFQLIHDVTCQYCLFGILTKLYFCFHFYRTGLSLLLNHWLLLLKKKLDEVEGAVMILSNKAAAYNDNYKHHDDLIKM